MSLIDIKAKVLKRIDLDMAIRYVSEKASTIKITDPDHYYYFKLSIEYMIEGGSQYYNSIDENFHNFFVFIIVNKIRYRNIKKIIDMEFDFYMSHGHIEKAKKATQRNKLFEL